MTHLISSDSIGPGYWEWNHLGSSGWMCQTMSLGIDSPWFIKVSVSDHVIGNRLPLVHQGKCIGPYHERQTHLGSSGCVYQTISLEIDLPGFIRVSVSDHIIRDRLTLVHQGECIGPYHYRQTYLGSSGWVYRTVSLGMYTRLVSSIL